MVSVLQVTVQKASFRMDHSAARCAFIDVKALHADGSMAALDRDGKLMLFNAGNRIDKVVSTRVRLFHPLDHSEYSLLK